MAATKVAIAKVGQGYVPKAPTCSGCTHLQSELKLQAWCDRANKRAVEAGEQKVPYPLDRYGIETNIRCAIGGFAIKKGGWCRKHQAKEEA